MNRTLKTILIIVACLVVVGAAYLIGRGALGGGIEQTVSFSIEVNPSGSFSMAITPSVATVTKGDPLSFSLTNAPTGGFDAQIQYTVGGLPVGSFSFSVNPVNAGQATTLTVDTSRLTSNTAYSCTITGVDR